MTPTLALLAALVLAVPADERKFTRSNEAQTLPKGSFELEQWITMEAGKTAGTYRKFTLREELEYGIFDNLTGAVYLNWEILKVRNVPGLEDESELGLEGGSLEIKWRMTDRALDFVGSLLYGEVTVGEDEVELEAKLVLNKVVGDFHFVSNVVFEYELEREEEPGGGEEWETAYVIELTFGVSYAANPNFAFGVEAVNTHTFEGSLGESESNVWFAGPAVHVAYGEFWGTLTAMRQVDVSGIDLEHHEKYSVRLIVGFGF